MTETLCLVATLAGRQVAIPAELVRAVVDLGEIVPVPRSDPAIVGIAALRSRVVTVIDGRRALGAEAVMGRRAVLLYVDGHDYALLVDDCADIAPVTVAPLPVGLALDAGWRAIAQGVVERDGTPLLLIAPAALVPQPLAA